MEQVNSLTVTKCRREILTGTHTWRLEGMDAIFKQYKEYEQPACTFTYFMLLGCQWKALFWPYGAGKKDLEEVVAVQLCLVASPQLRKQAVKLTVQVLHTPETKQVSKLHMLEPTADVDVRFLLGNNSTTDPPPSSHNNSRPVGFRCFMKHADLLAKHCEKDTFTMEFILELISTQMERQETPFAQLTQQQEQLYSIQRVLKEDFKDIALVTKNGQVLMANALLLAKMSPMVTGLLRQTKEKEQQQTLDFKQWDTQAVQIFIDFACAALLPAHWIANVFPPLTLTEAQIYEACQVYEMAHMHMSLRLLAIVRVLLLHNLNINNAYTLYAAAKHYGDATMIRHIEDFARCHIPHFLKRTLTSRAT